jgi:protein-disulfide isomerase
MTNARTAKSAREKAAEMRAAAAAAEARRRRTMIIASVLAGLVLVVGVVVMVKVLQDKKNADDAALRKPPQHVVNDGISFGKADAKVKIDLWEDFQCPVCLNFEQANATAVQGYLDAGTAQVTYHPVAILDRASTTNYSTRSANAAAVVLQTTTPAVWQAYHKLLYANQPPENSAGLPDSRLVSLAVQAGAKQADIEKGITGQQFQGWVASLTDTFSKKGYTGTPTVVVNGKVLTAQDSLDATKFKAAVDAAAKG